MSKKEDTECNGRVRGGEHELWQRVRSIVLPKNAENTNELYGKERTSGFYEVSIMSTTYSL